MRTRPSPPLLPLAILLLAASSCAKKDSPPWAPLSLPPGAFEGDLEIVTPIPMPQRKKGRVRVLLRLPPTGLIDVGEQGQLLLPPGARLARVEDIEKARGGYAVADVRGALFDEGGTRFFVLRPAAPRSASLRGRSWPRDDVASERAAHEALGEEMRSTQYGFLLEPKDRARSAAAFMKLGRCAACHVPSKAELAPGSDGGFAPARASDASGYYALSSLFRESEPKERYGPPQRIESAYFTQAEGRLRFDVAKAHLARDPHALAVCASRGQLAERMTPKARSRFAPLMAACGQAIARPESAGPPPQGS